MATDYSDWIGRHEQAFDVLEPARCNALRATLGNPLPLDTGYPLPLLHHWLYFWDVRVPQGLGADGHPLRGGFLPPVDLPRRMWAGGRLTFLEPLWLGEQVMRDSRILDVAVKSGRSGELVFVTVEHRLSGSAGLAIVEQQDIVYRGAQQPGTATLPQAADSEPACEWRQDYWPDPVMLFRYSGLTMNGHRIHYDRPYAIDEEAYPGLVVHGPLQASMLMQLALDNLDAPVATFSFRGAAPAFSGHMLNVCGNREAGGARLWTAQGAGACMEASVTCVDI